MHLRSPSSSSRILHRYGKCSFWTFIYVFSQLTTILTCALHTGHHKHSDYRHVSHGELLKTVETFQADGVSSYSQLIFDVKRHQLIAGARDHLFMLSLEGLQKTNESSWPAAPSTVETCRQKGQSIEDCHNFIKVLLTHGDSIFACGTNAFNPICTWRKIDNINSITESLSGVARCPYNPHQNISALITSEGNYYIASMVDFSARDPAIYRFMGQSSTMLRTVQYNSKWLSEPNFVSSFEIDNFVYFFFRETAIEFINCGKSIYSRVARVCKNDIGGQYMLKDNWTTFLKARINCSIPGEYPFYYNEIQSVFFVEENQMLYATFTTPKNSIYGSAICVFNMTAINKAFSGGFKYQSSATASWERQMSSHKHFECETPGNPPRMMASDKYQLMDEAVQPEHAAPIFTEELQRFSHIVVDVVPTKVYEGLHVLFVATMDGVIKKFSFLPRTQETCLVEIMHVFVKNHSEPIRQMKLLKDLHSLYLGTESAVLRIPVARCERYTSEKACKAAMDPYCGWHHPDKKCTPPPNNNPLNQHWEQSILSCPVLNDPVDGGWGPWGRWADCAQTGLQALGDRCLCRSRQCDHPNPANGGRDCKGESQEVSNCTRHGQWTEWSAWSACSQTCGMAVRMRRRSCGNPEPAFGGKYCDGIDKNEIYCASNPPCPSPVLQPIDGQWSNWGPWEDCSAECGGGFQMRRRRCDNPLPQNGGRDCVGCNTEYQQCNREQCSEKRQSHWTPWLTSNYSEEGSFQQRFRFVCRAHAPMAKLVVGHLKTEDRFCTKGGKNCIDKAFIGNDGDWSDWSTWSTCTAECGGGTQTRERACDNPKPSGRGEMCSGEAKQQRACNLQPCAVSKIDSEGPIPWTPWSSCDENNYQHRQLLCPAGSPTPCPEAKEESRLCDVVLDSTPMQTINYNNVGTASVGSMVAGCIVCFLIGAGLAGGATFIYTKKKYQQRAAKFGYLNNKNAKAQKNQYTTPQSKNNHTSSLNRTPSLLGNKRSNRSSFNTAVNSDMEKYG